MIAYEKKNKLTDLVLAVVAGLLCVVAIWWSPDYFTSGKLYNPGDMLFPYNIEKGILDRIDAWNYAGYSGMGKNENYTSPVTALYYIFLLSLKTIGAEITVLNRIYISLPTFVLGVSTSFFLLKSVEFNRIGKAFTVVGAVFFTSSLPLTNLDPLLEFGWAALIYLVWLLLDHKTNPCNFLKILIGGVSIAYLSATPRIMYLYFLILGINILSDRRNALKTLKIFVLICLVALPVFVYTLAPSIISKFHSLPSDFVSTDVAENRYEVIDFYTNSTSYSRSILLHYSQEYSYYNKLFNEPSVLIAAVILLIPVLYALLISSSKLNDYVKFSRIIFLSFTIYAVSFGSQFHRIILKVLPGFWILNNPQYILSISAIFFTVLLCWGVNKIALDYNYKKLKTLTLYCLFIISVISINRVMILNAVDGKKIELGQHEKYFEIPIYINEIIKIVNCDFSKTLVVPSSSNGYYTYKSWPITGMPNALTSFYCLNTFGLSKEELVSLKSVDPKLADIFAAAKLDQINRYGVKYILVQNDVIEAEQSDKLVIYDQLKSALRYGKGVKKIYSNYGVELYELSMVKPYIAMFLNNKLISSYEGSSIATSFTFPISKTGEYRIETLIPSSASWDIIIQRKNSEFGMIKQEIERLSTKLRNRTVKNGFVEWTIPAKAGDTLVVYNKSSVVSYMKMFLIFVISYYILFAIIYLMIKDEKRSVV